MVSASQISRPLVVFADDWGRHPSSCQHLVLRLLDRCTVYWLNTIGTRAPQLNPALIRRGLQKIAQWRSSGNAQGAAIRSHGRESTRREPHVLNPAMYPGFRSPWQRLLNASLLARFMIKNIPHLQDAVVVSTVPIVADLPERVSAARWVYYCVDDFSAWPGLDSAPLAAMERKLVGRADRIVVAGDNLAARMRQMGRDSRVIRHGIDLDHWRSASMRTDLLEGLEPPIVLFWGLIDRRIDPAYLAALDRRMSAGTIALVGPEQDPDPGLDGIARLKRVGAASYEALPAVAARASVLIMPYADLPVTRAMQPLKLKEYLANDKPVVVSRLPALAGWESCLDVADSAEAFADLVMMRVSEGQPDSQRAARQRLASETWQARSQEFADALFGELN